MAIPQKGSRLITVKEVEYRWYIRRKPYIEGGLTFAVERVSDEATTKLVVMTGYSRAISINRNPAYIRPSDVATAIQAALEAGWDPFAGKGTFEYVIKVGNSVI